MGQLFQVAVISAEPKKVWVWRDNPVVARCEQGHALKVATGDFLGCDVCKRHPSRAELELGFKRCAECKYDICRECSPISVQVQEPRESEHFGTVGGTKDYLHCRLQRCGNT